MKNPETVMQLQTLYGIVNKPTIRTAAVLCLLDLQIKLARVSYLCSYQAFQCSHSYRYMYRIRQSCYSVISVDRDWSSVYTH